MISLLTDLSTRLYAQCKWYFFFSRFQRGWCSWQKRINLKEKIKIMLDVTYPVDKDVAYWSIVLNNYHKQPCPSWKKVSKFSFLMETAFLRSQPIMREKPIDGEFTPLPNLASSLPFYLVFASHVAVLLLQAIPSASRGAYRHVAILSILSLFFSLCVRSLGR